MYYNVRLTLPEIKALIYAVEHLNAPNLETRSAGVRALLTLSRVRVSAEQFEKRENNR